MPIDARLQSTSRSHMLHCIHRHLLGRRRRNGNGLFLHIRTAQLGEFEIHGTFSVDWLLRGATVAAHFYLEPPFVARFHILERGEERSSTPDSDT